MCIRVGSNDIAMKGWTEHFNENSGLKRSIIQIHNNQQHVVSETCMHDNEGLDGPLQYKFSIKAKYNQNS